MGACPQKSTKSLQCENHDPYLGGSARVTHGGPRAGLARRLRSVQVGHSTALLVQVSTRRRGKMARKVSEIALELADREAIRDCLLRYPRAIDRIDIDLLS